MAEQADTTPCIPTTANINNETAERNATPQNQQQREEEILQDERRSTFTAADYLYLVAVSSGYLLSMMLISVYISFFPTVAQSRGASNTLVGAMLVTFSVVQVVGSAVIAAAAPTLGRIGPRRVYLAGLLVCFASTAGFGCTELVRDDTTFLALCFVVRCVQAAGTVAVVTSAFTLATGRFPHRVTVVSGVMEASNGLASALGPGFGGVLYDAAGFAAPFYTMAALFAVSAVLVLTCVDHHSLSVDVTTKPSEVSSAHAPISGWRVLTQSRDTWLISCLLLFGSFNWSAMSSYLQPYLAARLQTTASEIGVLYLIGCGVFGVASPFWGWLAHHCSRRYRKNCVYPQMAVCFVLLGVGVGVMDPSCWRRLLTPWLPERHLVAISRTSVLCGFTLKEAMMAGMLLPTLAALMHAAQRAGLSIHRIDTHSLVNGWWYGVRSSADIVGPLWAGPLADRLGYGSVLCLLTVFNMVMALVAVTGAVFTTSVVTNNE